MHHVDGIQWTRHNDLKMKWIPNRSCDTVCVVYEPNSTEMTPGMVFKLLAAVWSSAQFSGVIGSFVLNQTI
jgi:hypothetical protein